MSKNLRDYASQTRFRLIIWFIFILLFIGLGLVWIIYGRSAAILCFFCLLGASIPIGLIMLFLFGIDRIAKSDDE